MKVSTATNVGNEVKAGVGVAGSMHGGPFDPGDGGPPPGQPFRPEKYRIGIWVALASILMLFAALTSSYIVHQTRWPSGGLVIQVPALLWVNSGVLIASSATLEIARWSLGRARFQTFNRWMSVTAILGIAFVVAQIVVWRQLASQGIYVNSSPHSSFFYVLTGLHGLHLFGGLLALLYVSARAFRYDFGPARRTAVDVTAIYWHFMDGLWVLVFSLLFFWR